MPPTVTIRTFDWPDYEAVVALWQAVELRLTVSDSRAALAATLEHAADLFVVAEAEGQIMGAVLGTFDGRRGWLHHLAVAPAWQGNGVGRRLVAEVEARLRTHGCAKINLHVEPDNVEVAGFYDRIGYVRRELVFMEKWL
jgi:ribosomal protein S18 acetylase RimI-like enzyme